MSNRKYPHLKELFHTDKSAYFNEWRKLNPEKFPIADQWRVLEKHDALPIDAREIPGYPTYYATPNGEIWRDTINEEGRVKNGKEKIVKLKDRYNSECNYHQVQPYVDGKRKLCYVHRLVLLAFAGEPIDDRNEAHHIDHNPSNNSADNLMWVTRLENARFVPTHHRTKSKKKLGNGRALSNSRWRPYYSQIKDMMEMKIRPVDIAEILGIPKSTIYHLVNKL
jgi:hypothetical protein